MPIAAENQLISMLTLVGLLVACLAGIAASQAIEVGKEREFELFAMLKAGEKWGVQFQTVHMPVDVRLVAPKGVIHSGAKEEYGSYVLTAETDGRHYFVFDNKKGSAACKVTFRILGDAAAGGNVGAAREGTGRIQKLDPVMEQLRKLNADLRAASDEHAFLMEREVQHRFVALNTNTRVLWWFLAQVAVISGAAYFQIRSLKRFFEVRHLV